MDYMLTDDELLPIEGQMDFEDELRLLHELQLRYGGSSKGCQPFSASERHALEQGHRLTYGCCRELE
jgi:hypothetical protein